MKDVRVIIARKRITAICASAISASMTSEWQTQWAWIATKVIDQIVLTRKTIESMGAFLLPFVKLLDKRKMM